MDNPRLSNVVVYRESVKPSDVKDVMMVAQSSGFFNAHETQLASELVEEALAAGGETAYRFIFAERSGKAIGFACFGLIQGTESSFDLYWIALMDAFRGMGIGHKLISLVEQKVRQLGGTRIYIETSDRESYDPTREFYTTNGYREEALLKDFFGPGESKKIYLKILKT